MKSLSCTLSALLLFTLAFTPAEYNQHAEQLKKKLPPGFTVVIQPPFVVIGDEPPATVRTRATSTVQWATDHLKKTYFANDPADILDIFLFKNNASYEKHTKALFNDRPTTPFGYYSQTHKALVMNIETGGGTLVHEIVHPFIHANFPDCPAWFNEGLGSLYEQSAEKDGHIVGLTNWRLPALQDAIKKNSLPSFQSLTSTTPTEFYSKDRGSNYAHARYLCYYLQEKHLLTKFYKQFLENQKDDPTGYQTLQAVLSNPDMNAFQKTWQSFILTLTFP